jgi:hypothetical protein
VHILTYLENACTVLTSALERQQEEVEEGCSDKMAREVSEDVTPGSQERHALDSQKPWSKKARSLSVSSSVLSRWQGWFL